MRGLLRTWLAPLVLGVCLVLPVAAQAPAAKDAKKDATTEESFPLAAYTVAFLAAAAVLVVICLPARRE